MIFSGTFTAGGLEVAWPDGRFTLTREGRSRKLVAEVGQLSYNGRYAFARAQEVLYVTERAVFRLGADGLELIEIGPGVDLERHVLAQMGFRPKVAADLKTMDAALFQPEPIALASRIARARRRPRSSRVAEWRAQRGLA